LREKEKFLKSSIDKVLGEERRLEAWERQVDEQREGWEDRDRQLRQRDKKNGEKELQVRELF